MQQLLTEYYQLKLTPQQITEVASTEAGGPMIIRNVLLQRAETFNRNKRRYPKAILEREMGKYDEIMVKNNRALGELDHCFTSNDFDVLTKDGWKPFIDIEKGELVMSYNMETREYEYKPVLKVIDKPYTGDSFKITGRGIDTQVTPNHKFVLQDRYGDLSLTKISDVYDNRTKYDKSKIIKTGNWIAEFSGSYTLPGAPYFKNSIKKYTGSLDVDSEVLAGIVGVWLAEGSTGGYKGRTNGQVLIHQNEGEKFDEIKTLLDESPFEYRVDSKSDSEIQKIFRIKDHRLYQLLSGLGNKYTKYIPDSIKNLHKEALENLLYFFNLGDGRKQKNVTRYRQNVFTVSKKLIDDLQECLIKTGGSGNLTTPKSEGGYIRGRKVKNVTALNQLEFSSTKGIYLDKRFLQIEKVHHDGRIYCLEVADNHTFCVRQNNKHFITGNSNENVVNLKNVCLNIKESWWDGNDVLGNIEILDGPEFPAGRILAGLLKRGIPVGISSRGMGSVNEIDEEGHVEVSEDFSLLCYDAVSFESTQGATIKTVNEGYVNPVTNRYQNVDAIIFDLICNNSGACSCMFEKK